MDCIIPINDLKSGQHQYEYDVTNEFFEQFQNAEVNKGNVHALLNVTKHGRGVEVQFNLKGYVTVACDRCLEEFDLNIESNETLFFEYGTETGEVSSELIMIPEGESLLNVSQYIYEFICLAIPFQKYHPDDENGNSTCNKEMLDRLESMKVNEEEKTTEIDPRWDKLKDLIN